MNDAEWVKDIRTRIRESLPDKVSQDYKENIEKGLYPYDGMWLTLSQIQELQEYLKKTDKIVFIEVILLFIGTTGISLALYGLLRFILPR